MNKKRINVTNLDFVHLTGVELSFYRNQDAIDQV